MSSPLDVTEVHGGGGYNPSLHTPRRDAFTSIVQAKDTYLTTREFAKLMRVDDKQVHRWCDRWYGRLPPTRHGRGMGYRIHPWMVRVARGWLQTMDMVVRDAIREAIEKSSTNPPAQHHKDWVVVVGKQGWTYYTAPEAMAAVNKKIPTVPRNYTQVAILYVGDPTG